MLACRQAISAGSDPSQLLVHHVKQTCPVSGDGLRSLKGRMRMRECAEWETRMHRTYSALGCRHSTSFATVRVVPGDQLPGPIKFNDLCRAQLAAT